MLGDIIDIWRKCRQETSDSLLQCTVQHMPLVLAELCYVSQQMKAQVSAGWKVLDAAWNDGVSGVSAEKAAK